MIPVSVTIIDEEGTQPIAPSLTYKIDYFNNNIIGTFDGRDAVIQAIRKMLNTDRYAYEIYDWYYGHELTGLIGQPYDYIVTTLPKLVEDCLLQDDRIIKVHDFTFSKTGLDNMLVNFSVQTVYGLAEIEMEVAV